MRSRADMLGEIRRLLADVLIRLDGLETEAQQSAPEALRTVDEIAQRLRTSRRVVLEAHRSGSLQTSQPDRRTIVATDSAVAAWLASRCRLRAPTQKTANVVDLLDRQAARIRARAGRRA